MMRDQCLPAGTSSSRSLSSLTSAGPFCGAGPRCRSTRTFRDMRLKPSIRCVHKLTTCRHCVCAGTRRYTPVLVYAASQGTATRRRSTRAIVGGFVAMDLTAQPPHLSFNVPWVGEASYAEKKGCPGETPHLVGNAIKLLTRPVFGSGPSGIPGGSGFADDPQARTYHQSWPVAKLSAVNSAFVRRVIRSQIWGRWY